MSGILAALHPRPPPPPPRGPDGKPKQPAIPPPTPRLLLGLLGVLLAALSSYLNQYGTTFAQSDLFGGLNAGQDEGSWVAVAFDCGSVSIVVITAWLSTIISPRRVVAGFLIVQTLAAVAVPTMTSYAGLVALAFLHGVGGGALVPMLFTTLLRILRPQDRLWGFAAYASVVNLSPLSGDLISGYLTEYIGWQTNFWICLVLNPIALVLVMVGLPVETLKLEGFTKGADYLGMFFFVVFGTTFTAALVVGQRFNWFSSTLIDTLFVVSAIFLILFIWEELSVEQPLVQLRLLKRRNLSLGLLIIVMFFFAVQGAAYLLPQYGTQVRSFRELQVGAILIWAAIPVVVLAPLVAWLLFYVDARVVAALGFLLVVIADRLTTYLTSDWVEAQFLAPQIIAACGYPFVLVSLLLCVTSVMQPQDAISGSTLFNLVRVLAGNVGSAIIGAIVVVRERVHSNIIASDAMTGAFGTVQREVAVGGLSGLSAEVHREAFVMAYADAYGWIAMIMIAGMVVLLFMGEATVARRPKKNPKREKAGPAPQPAE